MFNLWPKNEVKEIIDNMPKFAWSVDPSFYIDEKEYTAGELVDYIKNLLKENKNLEDILKSIEEDGTVEHNNAIKLREENVQLKNDIENYKKGNINWTEIYYEKIASTIYHEKTAIIDELVKKNTEIENELSLVETEQEAIVAANHKMAQELKEKNDRVILLENAVDRWSSRAKSWEKIDEELKSNISELTKEVVNLRHLKTENVELNERIKKLEEDILKYKNGNRDWCSLYESACKDRTDLENKLDFEQKKYQILDHNYQGCTKYRDEYKHQLNAANNEIEALKKEKKESFDILKEAIENESKRFHKLVVENLDLYNGSKNLQGKLDDANKEVEALKSKLRDYQDKYAESFSYNDMNGLQKEIDDLKLMYKERESKLKTYNTSLLGQIAGLKEEIAKLQNNIVDYVFEKTEEQKHPMYPIHWGTLDPDIYEKAKNISIEEAIKDVVRAEVENEDPFEGIPKSFPNEFQDETTSDNLEEKFDKGEDVLDYFEKPKPWQCPCNMCKQERERNTEKSWEETASDLALRVIKLEKKIEELTIGNINGSNHKI